MLTALPANTPMLLAVSVQAKEARLVQLVPSFELDMVQLLPVRLTRTQSDDPLGTVTSVRTVGVPPVNEATKKCRLVPSL